MSKLILIEGIPGSGKTSTARFVCDRLAQQGQQPALFLEGDWNHPADYESVACLEQSEYAGLQEQFPTCLDFLSQHAELKNGEWFFSYRKMQHENPEQAPDALFEALAHFEIYDLPAEKHQRLMRQSWRNFAGRALDDDFTYVFECCFLQNPTTTLLARHNLPVEAIYQHVRALADAIQPLQPRLIYLAPQNPRAALEHVRAERPKEWADYVTGYLTGQEFGKTRGLDGFEGVIQFYEMRQKLEVQLLRDLPFQSLMLEHSGKEWQRCNDEISTFINI